MNDYKDTDVFTADSQERLDQFLVKRIPNCSRRRIQDAIRDGLVSVNNKKILKSGHLVNPGCLIKFHLPPLKNTDLRPENIPLEIIFENKDLLIVNKPAGMVVHPSPGHSTGTLVNAALNHIPDLAGIGGELRPGIVHRLDKDTSGLIVVAKNDISHRWLQDQFKQRKVDKYYIALVDGRPPTPSGIVNAPIGRNTIHRKLMAVAPDKSSREAISEYRTLEKYHDHTLLEVHPLTGRTHQIRVHMAFLGCPITGDLQYGKRKSTIKLDRHFLHASKLSITLPGEDRKTTFETTMPDELEAILVTLRD